MQNISYISYVCQSFCKTGLKYSLEEFGWVWSSGVVEKLLGEVGCMLRDCTWCEMKKAWMMETGERSKLGMVSNLMEGVGAEQDTCRWLRWIMESYEVAQMSWGLRLEMDWAEKRRQDVWSTMKWRVLSTLCWLEICRESYYKYVEKEILCSGVATDKSIDVPWPDTFTFWSVQAACTVQAQSSIRSRGNGGRLHKLCTDCCIAIMLCCSSLVNGCDGCSCLLLLHPIPTSADAGHNLCTLHHELCTLCLWCIPLSTGANIIGDICATIKPIK